MHVPSYVRLHDSGELVRRVKLLLDRLRSCDICPRDCRVDRMNGVLGFCGTARDAVIAAACSHRGEEPPLSGTRGSGTVFFARCNLHCVYCQNYQISQGWVESGVARGRETLADAMLRLQGEGCHNINLVSPSHVVPQIAEALLLAVPQGLRLPLVYNTNAYDSVDVLRALDGVIDIYMPDLKYASNAVAARFSRVSNYVEVSRAAIIEMYRQVGDTLVIGADGTAIHGLIVRHLVLPGGLAGTLESLGWLARSVSTQVTLSLMSQYYPTYHAKEYVVLSRRTSASEYAAAVRMAEELGFEHVWVQDPEAEACYRPDFRVPGHPFEPDAR